MYLFNYISLCMLMGLGALLPLKAKQGLFWTQKLQQRTHWKVNLQVCKQAKVENWSIQLNCLAVG